MGEFRMAEYMTSLAQNRVFKGDLNIFGWYFANISPTCDPKISKFRLLESPDFSRFNEPLTDPNGANNAEIAI